MPAATKASSSAVVVKPSMRPTATLDGVTVTGTVDSIWNHLDAVDVCAFPMFAGAGLQNKVLEAMVAGRPVVTTPIGNEGIDAKPGSEIVVAEDEEGFARAIERLRRMDFDERVANGCIGPQRADLVLAGCAIFEAIREMFPAKGGK